MHRDVPLLRRRTPAPASPSRRSHLWAHWAEQGQQGLGGLGLLMTELPPPDGPLTIRLKEKPLVYQQGL